jgi:hypothetical protein
MEQEVNKNMTKRYRIKITIEETAGSHVPDIKHLMSEVSTLFGKYGIKELTIKEEY